MPRIVARCFPLQKEARNKPFFSARPRRIYRVPAHCVPAMGGSEGNDLGNHPCCTSSEAADLRVRRDYLFELVRIISPSSAASKRNSGFQAVFRTAKLATEVYTEATGFVFS